VGKWLFLGSLSVHFVGVVSTRAILRTNRRPIWCTICCQWYPASDFFSIFLL
jgi:hypothetical protein